MPSPNKITLKSYLTPAEYQYVREKARQAKMSLSTFVKNVCLAQEVRSKTDQEAVLALIKATADLGRLGGLLKKGLSDYPDLKILRELLNSIEQSKTIMQRQFENLMAVFLDEK
jgi:hypothetical protein